MRLKNNQSGFSAVEAILLLVVVGIIGGTGWFVWHSKQVADKNLSTTGTTTVSESKSAKISTSTPTKTTTASTQLSDYTTKNHGFTFKYPSTWTVNDTSTSGGTDLTDAVTLTAPSGFTVSLTTSDTGHPGADYAPSVLSVQKLTNVSLTYDGNQPYLDYITGADTTSNLVTEAMLSTSADQPFSVYQFGDNSVELVGKSKAPESVAAANADADYTAFVNLAESLAFGS